MNPMTCDRAETLLARATPHEVARELRSAGDLGRHLAGCGPCRELALGIAGLDELAPAPHPPAPLVAGTMAAATAALRELRRRRRAAHLRSALLVVLGTAAGLPVVIGLHLGVAAAFDAASPYLPELLRLYVGAVLLLVALGSLSGATLILFLIAGAAARPPRAREN